MLVNTVVGYYGIIIKVFKSSDMITVRACGTWYKYVDFIEIELSEPIDYGRFIRLPDRNCELF